MKQKYLYVILVGFPIRYLCKKKNSSGEDKVHPYEKETWTTTTLIHRAFRGVNKHPPRKKFGDSSVVSIEVEKIGEFKAIYKTIIE